MASNKNLKQWHIQRANSESETYCPLFVEQLIKVISVLQLHYHHEYIADELCKSARVYNSFVSTIFLHKLGNHAEGILGGYWRLLNMKYCSSAY